MRPYTNLCIVQQSLKLYGMLMPECPRTVNAGTAWNTISWPNASHINRSHHTPTFPAQPTGSVPATGGTVSWTVTWAPTQRTVNITLPMGMMLGAGGGLNQTVNCGTNITQINLVTTSADFFMPESYNITVGGQPTGLIFTRIGNMQAQITGRVTSDVTHTVNSAIHQSPMRRNVSLMMYLHHSYRDTTANYRTDANNVVHDANRAFLHPEINIQFILQGFQNVVRTMPMDGWPPCSCASANLDYFRNNIFGHTVTLGALIYSAELCVPDSSPPYRRHTRGLASFRGRTSINEFRPGHQDNVRLLQHELSHNFGVHDSTVTRCSPDHRCVMSSAMWNMPDLRRTDIWCDNHRREFMSGLPN